MAVASGRVDVITRQSRATVVSLAGIVLANLAGCAALLCSNARGPKHCRSSKRSGTAEQASENLAAIDASAE
jgi:hypothetical protein